ncbi:MAG: hypothetical protein KKB02_07945 [Alphaproteobacteria bacterium]|nr:hypothetical protein [Alphaproteobacteria bacterium]
MLKALFATILSLAVLIAPTASVAEGRHYNGAEPDWRGLFQQRGHDRGNDRWHDGGLGPLTAPPVIVAPRYDDRPPALPARCLARVDTRYGPQDIYGAACLRDDPRLAARLPQACRVRVDTWGGIRDGYDAACLRRAAGRSRY